MPENAIPLDGPTQWRQISGWVKMNDGTVHRVVTTTADRIGYGHAARRPGNGWPQLGSKDMDVELWQTYLLYHALYRGGVYADSFESFIGDAAVVQVDEEGQPVDPTVSTP